MEGGREGKRGREREGERERERVQAASRSVTGQWFSSTSAS